MVKLISYDEAKLIANKFIKELRRYNDIDKLVIVGSFRRKKDKLKDIDFLTNTKLDKINLDKIKNIKKIISGGEKKISLIYEYENIRIQLDLFYSDNKSWQFALLHYTGDKLQNIKLRTKAKKKGYKLNQYGIFDENDELLKIDEKDITKVLKNEKDIFEFLGKKYKTPKERSNFEK